MTRERVRWTAERPGNHLGSVGLGLDYVIVGRAQRADDGRWLAVPSRNGVPTVGGWYRTLRAAKREVERGS